MAKDPLKGRLFVRDERLSSTILNSGCETAILTAFVRCRTAFRLELHNEGTRTLHKQAR